MKQKQFQHNLLSTPTLLREDGGEGGRFYVSPNGTRLPSVTNVLSWSKKDSLVQWRNRVGEDEANRIAKKAANRGTKFHAVCEDYLNNKEIDYSTLDPRTLDLFHASINHINRIDNIYGIELPLYSNYLGVAGTADCIANFDGKRSIIDFKTSNKPKKEEWIDDYFMQTACYAVMVEELTGTPVPNLVIIIAVDDDSTQLFTQKRDKWVDKAAKVITSYYHYHGLDDGRLGRIS